MQGRDWAGQGLDDEEGRGTRGEEVGRDTVDPKNAST
jgi:hypothetical protein